MNEKINVITTITFIDDDGFQQEDVKEIELFAEVESTNYNDFYGSSNENVRATVVFVLRREDYDLTRYTVNDTHYYPNQIKWDGATYRVVRSHYKDKHTARLICG